MRLLSDLKEGQLGRIQEIQGEDVLSQRLREMGLLEGDVVEVVGFAPLGDPMELRLNDYFLSLRKVEASRILVIME
jgi:ferrous iron transport protein A